MNTTNGAVGTGLLVVLGSWSEGKGISIRLVVGVLFLSYFMAILPERLAVPFMWLILTAVTFRYAPGIIAKTGITKGAPVAETGPDYDDGTEAVGV